ncbi:hypothetical protein V7S79_04055 [Aquirufa sp. ROCK-SH2]
MSPNHKKSILWITGLILIITIYTLFYLFFVENKEIVMVPRKIRHLIKFLTTFSVYFIGTYFLGKFHVKWMGQLWHFIHISLLGTLILVGFYDWAIHQVSQHIKDLSVVFQEFLISPTLYVGMGIINRSGKR